MAKVELLILQRVDSWQIASVRATVNPGARAPPGAGDAPSPSARDDIGMAKKDKHEQHDAEVRAPGKMKRKEYERQMRILHGELVAMQEWVKKAGAKVCVVFEAGIPPGREARSSGSPSESAPGCSGS